VLQNKGDMLEAAGSGSNRRNKGFCRPVAYAENNGRNLGRKGRTEVDASAHLPFSGVHSLPRHPAMPRFLRLLPEYERIGGSVRNPE